MLPELTDYAGPLALVAAGLLLAIVGSSATRWLPVPAPALFLASAAVTAQFVPAIGRDLSIVTVERIAIVALIVILLNGGRDIGAQRMRRSLGDIASIGLVGTFATAAALTVASHVIFGFPWAVAGVLGAALAPTDPAVMFSVLGRREVAGKSGTVLEGEAGINDPAGIALLLGMIQVATHPDASVLIILQDFVVQMSVGIAIGAIGGLLLIGLLRRIQLDNSGLYPILALTWAGLLYGATTLAGGSGFSAVFVTGLLLGDAQLPYRGELDGFTSGLASLAEVAVFLALGLTIDLGRITAGDWLGGLLLLLVLAAVIRPLVVVVTLARTRLSRTERAFIAWSGLKGAVPILLAAFAVLAHVDHAERIYDIVFVVVLGSVVVQGGLLPTVAKALHLPIETAPAKPWRLDVPLAERPPQRSELTVAEGSTADGSYIRGIAFGSEASVTLVVRNEAAIPPRGDLELKAGDVVFVLGAHNLEMLDEVFTAPRGSLS